MPQAAALYGNLNSGACGIGFKLGAPEPPPDG